MNANAVVPNDSPEFVLRRMFDAPRELVYKVWTDPRFVKQWWGVNGSTIVCCKLDVRPGGTFRIDMKTSDGIVYVNRGVYDEVVVNYRIVTRDERDVSAASRGVPIGIHTVTFDDVAGGTLVTLRSRFADTEQRDVVVRLGMVDGIGQSLKRFEQLVIRTMQERK